MRPRPDADLAGRRAASADGGGAAGGPRGRDPRRDRDRPDVPLRPSLRRGGGNRGPARLLPGRRRRRSASAASGSCTSRSRSRSPARRSAPSQDEGFALNCYVDDELYVAAITEHARAYADFQSIPLHEVGDLLGWIERPPTKLVVVDDPAALDALRPRLEARFGGRLYIAKSLPYFLELASPAISKGSGLAFVAEHVGFAAERTIAFGDGENDLELLDWAGFGIAVENADDRLKARADWICPVRPRKRASRRCWKRS